jgi:hypothetical protein
MGLRYAFSDSPFCCEVEEIETVHRSAHAFAVLVRDGCLDGPHSFLDGKRSKRVGMSQKGGEKLHQGRRENMIVGSR